MRWPAGTTVSGCWRRWSGSIFSSSRWTTSGAGTATTTCSPRRYAHVFTPRTTFVLCDLHRAAARWYASEGMIADALSHALAGVDPSLAADLVELGLPELSRQRQDRTLRDWLASLPTEEKRRRPVLATAHAWACLSRGDVDAVEPWLDAAERSWVKDPWPPSSSRCRHGWLAWRRHGRRRRAVCRP